VSVSPTMTILFCIVATSCAAPREGARPAVLTPAVHRSAPAPSRPTIRPEDARARAVGAAGRLVGPLRGGGPRDAVALIQTVYGSSGVEIPRGSQDGTDAIRALHAWARQEGLLHQRTRPNAGDVAFFHDTHDENGDGRRNDPLTHAALVERVEQDGTVVLISRVKSGVVRLRMNLQQPAVRRDRKTGRVLNHYLRAALGREQSRTAAQLFAGFASMGGGITPPRVAMK